ncbi:MAG: hypothetical protein CMP59_11185 [Flavobacteriales bacterium]|nr:hypothetical protein [Flavobacteriales bacterium]|tara:strand:- start:943 stop:1566 length:624 start_codon:yes stop_codon:yes gene_type:complete
MKKYLLLTPIIMLLSCTPHLNVVWQKQDFKGDHFKKLVVVAITNNLETRNLFEETAVRTLKNKGIKAYHGVDFFPPIDDPHLQSKETLKQIVLDNEIDGVITMSLIDKQESEQYVQGSVYSAPPYYDPYYGYMYNRYQTVYTPGYYIENETYVIEGALHDLNLGLDKEHRLVWRGQSSLVNPTSVKSAAVDFSLAMVNYLVKNEVVK